MGCGVIHLRPEGLIREAGNERGGAARKPRGGSIPPLEEFAGRIPSLIDEQPELTLFETVAELRKRRIRTSRSSLWRFLDRHGIILKNGNEHTRSELRHTSVHRPRPP